MPAPLRQDQPRALAAQATRIRQEPVTSQNRKSAQLQTGSGSSLVDFHGRVNKQDARRATTYSMANIGQLLKQQQQHQDNNELQRFRDQSTTYQLASRDLKSQAAASRSAFERLGRERASCYDLYRLNAGNQKTRSMNINHDDANQSNSNQLNANSIRLRQRRPPLLISSSSSIAPSSTSMMMMMSSSAKAANQVPLPVEQEAADGQSVSSRRCSRQLATSGLANKRPPNEPAPGQRSILKSNMDTCKVTSSSSSSSQSAGTHKSAQQRPTALARLSLLEQEQAARESGRQTAIRSKLVARQSSDLATSTSIPVPIGKQLESNNKNKNKSEFNAKSILVHSGPGKSIGRLAPSAATRRSQSEEQLNQQQQQQQITSSSGRRNISSSSSSGSSSNNNEDSSSLSRAPIEGSIGHLIDERQPEAEVQMKSRSLMKKQAPDERLLSELDCSDNETSSSTSDSGTVIQNLHSSNSDDSDHSLLVESSMLAHDSSKLASPEPEVTEEEISSSSSSSSLAMIEPPDDVDRESTPSPAAAAAAAPEDRTDGQLEVETEVDEEEEEDDERDDQVEQLPARPGSLVKSGPLSILRQSFKDSISRFSSRSSMRMIKRHQPLSGSDANDSSRQQAKQRHELEKQQSASHNNRAQVSASLQANNKESQQGVRPLATSSKSRSTSNSGSSSSSGGGGSSTSNSAIAEALASAEARLLAAKQLKQQAQRLMDQQKREQANSNALDQSNMILVAAAAIQYNQQLIQQQQNQQQQQQQLQHQNQQQLMYHQQAQQYAAMGMAGPSPFDPMQQAMMQAQVGQAGLPPSYMTTASNMTSAAQYSMAAAAAASAQQQMAMLMSFGGHPNGLAMPVSMNQQMSPYAVSGAAYNPASRLAHLSGSKLGLSSSIHHHHQQQHQHHQYQFQHQMQSTNPLVQHAHYPGHSLIPLAVNHQSSLNIVYSGQAHRAAHQQQQQQQMMAVQVKQQSPEADKQLTGSTKSSSGKQQPSSGGGSSNPFSKSSLGATMRKTMRSMLSNRLSMSLSQARDTPIGLAVNSDTSAESCSNSSSSSDGLEPRPRLKGILSNSGNSKQYNTNHLTRQPTKSALKKSSSESRIPVPAIACSPITGNQQQQQQKSGKNSGKDGAAPGTRKEPSSGNQKSQYESRASTLTREQIQKLRKSIAIMINTAKSDENQHQLQQQQQQQTTRKNVTFSTKITSISS